LLSKRFHLQEEQGDGKRVGAMQKRCGEIVVMVRGAKLGHFVATCDTKWCGKSHCFPVRTVLRYQAFVE
jgi:hypothetical protein